MHQGRDGGAVVCRVRYGSRSDGRQSPVLLGDGTLLLRNKTPDYWRTKLPSTSFSRQRKLSPEDLQKYYYVIAKCESRSYHGSLQSYYSVLAGRQQKLARKRLRDTQTARTALRKVVNRSRNFHRPERHFPMVHQPSNMVFSQQHAIPDLGIEAITPEKSDIASPSPKPDPRIDNDGTQTSDSTLVQADESSLRRSGRQRKPTTKLDEQKPARSVNTSPKRRKTGEAQWISPPTPVSERFESTSISPDGVKGLQQLIPDLSLVTLNKPEVDQLKSSQHDGHQSSSHLQLELSDKLRTVSKKDKEDIERDLACAFLSKIHAQVYQPKFDANQHEQYFEMFRKAKNRPENQTHAVWKEATYWPAYDSQNPTYYDANGRKLAASSDGEKPGSHQGSEAPSPSLRSSKGAHTGKNGRNGGRGGNKSNKGRGTGGGKDRDSPEPPSKPILEPEERMTLTQVRQRQAELKRLFAVVGAQQKEALDKIAARELSKLHRKSKYHTKLPAYDEVLRDLQDKEKGVTNLINESRRREEILADQELKAQEEVINSRFKNSVEESRREHEEGAQGDLVIFRKAHLTAKDDTRTNNGSDIEPYMPRYHECPEPDVGPRGYTSSRIRDEKAFNVNLASYDEQAKQEVIDDEIVAPVTQSVADEHARRQAEEQQKARLDALVGITREELRQQGGYLIPRPRSPPENPQFALSRLADCAEYISRERSPEKEYIFMPIAPADVDTFPLHHLERVPPPIKTEDSRPSTSTSQSRPPSAKKPLPQRQKSLSISARRPHEEDTQNYPPSDPTASLPLIAPAPLRRPSLSIQQPASPFTQMPPPPTSSIPPSPAQSLSRRSSLAPLLLSRPPSVPAPPTPIAAQPTSSIPPPPSPNRFGPPLYPNMFPPILGQPTPQRLGYPFSQQPFHPAQPPPPPRFDRSGPAQSPVEYNAPIPEPQTLQHRFPSAAAPTTKGRVGGPRREPGQITFTPAQTPDSERFKNPPQPQPLPPGQAVYRPNSLQQLNSARNAANAVVNTTTTVAPELNSRSQQAADAARQTATINQGQGAGPKGGRRILLPKKC